MSGGDNHKERNKRSDAISLLARNWHGQSYWHFVHDYIDLEKLDRDDI